MGSRAPATVSSLSDTGSGSFFHFGNERLQLPHGQTEVIL